MRPPEPPAPPPPPPADQVEVDVPKLTEGLGATLWELEQARAIDGDQAAYARIEEALALFCKRLKGGE